MAYKIKICLYNQICTKCKHCRPDPERGGSKSCYLDEDLKGEEREKYLLQLVKHYGI